MDIKEIRDKKRLLEEEIEQKVLSFEKQTGVCIFLDVKHLDRKCENPIIINSNIYI